MIFCVKELHELHLLFYLPALHCHCLMLHSLLKLFELACAFCTDKRLLGK